MVAQNPQSPTLRCMMSHFLSGHPLPQRPAPEPQTTAADFVIQNFYFYSVLLLTLGNANQQTSIALYNPRATGCSTHVPTACARIPVVKGAIAPPELPAEPMKPIAVVCRWRGTVREKIVCAQGYTGPSTRPSNETATALPMMFGICHAKT